MRQRETGIDAYNKFAVYLSFVMFPVYFILGVFIIFSPSYFKDFSTFIRIALGSLFIAYAVARFYRTLQKIKNEKRKIKDEEQNLQPK